MAKELITKEGTNDTGTTNEKLMNEQQMNKWSIQMKKFFSTYKCTNSLCVQMYKLFVRGSARGGHKPVYDWSVK